MNTAAEIGKLSWEGTKLLIQMIYNNLPLMLMWIAIGFFVGIVLGIILVKVFRSKGIFNRPAKSSFSIFLNTAYKPIVFLSVLILSCTFCTYIGTKKILKKEIKHGVSETVEEMRNTWLKDEETREQMYAMLDVVQKGGNYIQTFNHVVAEAAIESYNQENDHGYIMTKFNQYFMVDGLEEKLWDLEKRLLYFVTAKVAQLAGMKEGIPVDYDAFSFAMDKWMESGFETDAEEIKIGISDFIYDHTKGFVLLLYLPILLLGLAFFVIPIIHYLIAKKIHSKHEIADISMDQLTE